jgi:hypothetical protein
MLLAVVAAWAHTYSQTAFMTVLLLAVVRQQQRGTQGIPAKIQIIGISTENYTWLTGGGINADYEIRWTHHLNDANYWRNRLLDKYVCW